MKIYFYITIFRHLFFNLFLLLLFVSCSPTTVSEKDLKQFILNEKNGLIKKITVDNTVYEVYFKPSELLAIQDSRPNDAKTYLALKKNYEKYFYFILNIYTQAGDIETNLAKSSVFKNSIHQILFNLNSSIRLATDNNQVIPLYDYIMPRTYGSTDHSTILLVFDKSKVLNSNGISLVIDDPLLAFNKISFSFFIKDLYNIPVLKF